MSLILPWVVFPLVLLLVGAGWGVLVERAAGTEVAGVLLVPLGWAAVIVFTLIVTEWSVIAPATVPLVAVAAVAGLVLGRRRFTRSRLARARWPALAALGVVLVYGGPVLAYGHATFTGFVKLDDTATWLDVIDHAMTHLHPIWEAPTNSTYQLVFTGDVGPTYPLGAFMLPAIGHALTSTDAAWLVQPYMALCAAAVALAVYALVEPLIASAPIRAAVAFIAAQSALLYGYSLWGGDKELAAAFLLALGAALLARAISEPVPQPRALLPLAIAAGALIDTLTVGAVAWIGPALVGLVVVWAYGARTKRAHPAAPGKAVAAPSKPKARKAGSRQTVAGSAGSGGSALARPARDLLLLCAATAAFILPVWLTVSQFLSERSSGLFSGGAPTREDAYGNLIQPLSGWQLAGIWPVGDFRLRAPTLPSVLLISLAIVLAAAAIWMSLRRRQPGISVYVGIALVGCLVFFLIGASPWALGKSLAISSPALLAAAATGAAMLWSPRRAPEASNAGAIGSPASMESAASVRSPASVGSPAGVGSPASVGSARSAGSRGSAGSPDGGESPGGVGSPDAGGSLATESISTQRAVRPHTGWRGWLTKSRRPLGMLALLAISGGVIWSNVLAYGDVTLAPHARLAELEHIGELVKGKGPTLINEYEVYADRHFLREGQPVEPAEYRPYSVPLRNGVVLTKTAWAPLSSFEPSTLEGYRSIVTRNAPGEARPPANYTLVWQGTYYQLWQRERPVTTNIVEEVPYGEANNHPFCGVAEHGETGPVCPIVPAAVPSCSQVHALARKAEAEHAQLVASEHDLATFAYGDEVRWPGTWYNEPTAHGLEALAPGTAEGHISVRRSGVYELWLYGGFTRGFEVSVDGRKVGSVSNQLSGFGAYTHVADVFLSAGIHRFTYTYPDSGLGPGSAENSFTSLAAVVLQPKATRGELVTVAPAQASRLCRLPLEWIELVKPA